jgi:hypothetical protein
LHPSILNYKLSKLFINAHISKRDEWWMMNDEW